jgi:hypothetical protein
MKEGSKLHKGPSFATQLGRDNKAPDQTNQSINAFEELLRHHYGSSIMSQGEIK